MNGPGAKDRATSSEASEPQGVLMNLYALCLNRYNVPLTVLYNMGGAHFLVFLSNSLSTLELSGDCTFHSARFAPTPLPCLAPGLVEQHEVA